MPRNYRHRPARRRKNTKSPPWVWMVAGLVIGLFVAFLVFLQMRPPEAPGDERIALETPPQRETRTPTPAAAKKPPPPTPKPPRFEFYNLLPEMEVIVPEQEIAGSTTREGVKQVEKPGTYLLQAGSFRAHKQADQLRARLALLGLETSIQTVSIDRKQAWHRVRVGPFNNLKDLNRARSLLRKNGIDAILIRLKG